MDTYESISASKTSPSLSTTETSSHPDPPSSIPIDIAMYHSLEMRAMELSCHLTESVQQIKSHMGKMSQGTIEAGQVYKAAVQELSDDLATCTQNTVQLITQCDELDKDLAQIQLLSKQIKRVDKGLDKLLQSI
ncbi:uncharacterized protein BX664DRAFT_336352 [Halteromyces radiatus]|uniref:uncharacterized protein n=1 Tax=Halteromyces radiatus TaxID=101107 RepID=UPI002220E82D|nr:uncharacterized protein BX664DRAFT_336352 [Halteromyces radiatus]KAI8086624.1 hypothetical protein BX664DRAFT_336352 [Halteromyces radiatus]